MNTIQQQGRVHTSTPSNPSSRPDEPHNHGWEQTDRGWERIEDPECPLCREARAVEMDESPEHR